MPGGSLGTSATIWRSLLRTFSTLPPTLWAADDNGFLFAFDLEQSFAQPYARGALGCVMALRGVPI